MTTIIHVLSSLVLSPSPTLTRAHTHSLSFSNTHTNTLSLTSLILLQKILLIRRMGKSEKKVEMRKGYEWGSHLIRVGTRAHLVAVGSSDYGSFAAPSMGCSSTAMSTNHGQVVGL